MFFSVLDAIPTKSFPVEPDQTPLDLKELAELLSHSEAEVNKMKGLNLWSRIALQRVEVKHRSQWSQEFGLD